MIGAQREGYGSARSTVKLWFLGSVAGALVVALPDNDARVFSLSQTHGPSTVDLLGMGVLVIACYRWLPCSGPPARRCAESGR